MTAPEVLRAAKSWLIPERTWCFKIWSCEHRRMSRKVCTAFHNHLVHVLLLPGQSLSTVHYHGETATGCRWKLALPCIRTDSYECRTIIKGESRRPDSNSLSSDSNQSDLFFLPCFKHLKKGITSIKVLLV